MCLIDQILMTCSHFELSVGYRRQHDVDCDGDCDGGGYDRDSDPYHQQI